ncbi:DOPA 4,5-dioxygenase family protein [Marinomonas transparens]|uniref:DOPA 4,5-dioxygenase family protein n=1 Tax=Marinomonas transparens TaxID=2795388 RepID=A0A934JNW0_9GAMM|nr:DOPA 4,5-dioxygenase family protein [Marinomonas transparens]MBJ7539685.1 DOPA 4,5-dioxygenase family protein [Marinomonas transparens]
MSQFSYSENIKAFHAHLYYRDEAGTELAKQIAKQAEALFEIKVGRFHQKQVGPHPLWSCQLSFAAETFGKIIPWLMFNRQTLDVFVHPLTGNDYVDHTQGVSWLGNSHTLNTAQFTPPSDYPSE